MTQPTALFLADVLDADPDSKLHHDAAAAELRRLTRERDALLTALKALLSLHDGQATWDAATTRAAARTVIAKTEGKNS